MKVSKLIKLLERAKDKWGDLDIRISDEHLIYNEIEDIGLSSEVKRHPEHKTTLLYNYSKDLWLSKKLQKKFDELPMQQCLFFSTVDLYGTGLKRKHK